MPAELMFGQKPIMPVERTIISWMLAHWLDEMSWEELLAVQIRQLEQRLEDIERAKEWVRETRLKNKGRFDQTHRLRLKKIEEGDRVLVYDNHLAN